VLECMLGCRAAACLPACLGGGQGGITGCLRYSFHTLITCTLLPLPPASLPAWPQDACFVLELVKQEQGKPKSMHFT
jgi:hypothetical protein